MKTLGERIREQSAPDQTDKKNTDQHATQKLSISETLDGMWDFSGRFSPEYGAIIKNMVDAFTSHPCAEEILADPALATSPGQRRAIALVEICRQAREHSEHCNGVSDGRGSLIVAIPSKTCKPAGVSATNMRV